MKRIIIICEGPTEQAFCKEVLQPYFLSKDIYFDTPLIKQGMGGIVSWRILKKEIETYLKSDTTAFLTTFIDYYGLTKSQNFPNWEDSMNHTDSFKRVDALEVGMKRDIESSYSDRFFPYIQLHEFEGLLFIDEDVFYNIFSEKDITGKAELISIINKHDNPELINNNIQTSPSNRLKRIIKGYQKVLHGSFLAEYIGVERIRQKAERFNSWINSLENL